MSAPTPIHPDHPGTPLVLLPVRIETRFTEQELLVRIYPDTIHVDTHEPDLTPAEAEAGQRFWADTAASADPEAAVGVWRGLAATYGPARAAWIARSTRTGGGRVGAGTGSWSRAPKARLLPTRWHVRGHYVNHWGAERTWEVVGNEIPRDLAVGPDPQAPLPEGLADGVTPVDEGMRWLVDFEAAERVGMAVRVPRSGDWQDGLDALYVVGVDEDKGPAEGAAALAALLEAHYYTDGFGFLEPGTPTNNTETERAGATARAEELSERYRLGDAAAVPPGPHPAGSVAAALTGALGLGTAGAALFSRDAKGARVDHQAEVNTVTWQAHLGYFLANLLREVPTAGTTALRRFYIDRVRPGGHLPVLRLGDQPYGVLPTSASPPYSTENGGTLIAYVLSAVANTAGELGPHVRGGENGMADLVEVLALQPRTVSYEARALLGPEYLRHLWRFASLDLPANWWQPFHHEYRERMRRMGLDATRETLIAGAFAAESYPVTAPLVGTGAGGYLAELLGMGPDELRAATGGADTPLLHRFVRHAALQELRNALALFDGDRRHVEPEFVDLDTDLPPTGTLWRELARPAPEGSGHATLGDFLADPATTHPATAQLREFRAALAAMGARTDEELTRLVGDAMDTAAYRRDAWTAAVAADRLARQRAPRPDGVLVGGFGWLFDLRPRELETAPTPEGQTGPVLRDPANGGHITAPSLHHATTAGVLRAGFVARGGAAGDGAAVAVDLGPERARLVRHLTEGVRAGQPLTALLGYRFERALTESYEPAVRALLPAFRALAPQHAQVLDAHGGAAELTRATGVVDGLGLLRRHRSGDIPWGRAADPADPGTVLPAAGSIEQQLCEGALAVLADAVDALADASLAEGVHQLVGGNPTRAGAALDALTRGEAPVPDLDVLRTPRTGALQHHRLLFLAHVDEARDVPVWPTDGRQIRAALEPTVNGWAAALLGDPARVRCLGHYPGHDPVEATLDELRLSPVDVLCLAGADHAHREEELRRRFTDVLRLRRPAAVPEHVMPAPSFDRSPAWGPEVLSVREFLTMAADVAALVAAARPVRGADLAAAGEAVELTWDVAGHERKVHTARTRLEAVRAQLATAVGAGDIGAMGGALVSLAAFGVQGAFPEIGRAWDEAWRAELTAVARTALAEADRRLAELADLEARTPLGLSGEDLVLHHVDRLRCLLGEDFPSVPTWRPATAADRAALGELLDHGAELLADDPMATGPWLDQLARVRPGARRLHTALAAAEATGAPAAQDLAVGQLPREPGARWAALPGPDARAARTCVAAHTTRPVDLDATLAGLVLDEWAETVPGDTEVTGLAFHYDAPGARAPQSLLLAVTEGEDATWDVPTIQAAVAQAYEAARQRTGRQEDVGMGHFLPALFYPFNAADDTVSTDFTGAAAQRGVDA